VQSKPIQLARVLLGATFAIVCTAGAANNALTAFHQLQSLAGDWEGKDEHGAGVKSNFKRIAGNTAVMETLDMPGMDEMVTLYSIDGDTIALMHYCPTGNQPRMRARPSAGIAKSLTFVFEGAGNLPNLAIGHEQRLVLDFVDRDHIVEHWTWRKNGKDAEMVFRLTRKNS
jgi:hypothetical protein